MTRRRLWRLVGINVASFAASAAAFHFFPGPAMWVFAAWLLTLPIWWNLHSLATSNGVRPEMAGVLGQLFVVVLAVGFLYFLARGGGELRLLVAGCYFAALTGAWVYKLAYRRGAKDGVAELGRRMRAVPRSRPMASHAHRPPRPSGAHVVDVEPRDEP